MKTSSPRAETARNALGDCTLGSASGSHERRARPATHADLPSLLVLCRRMHAKSAFSHLPFDEGKVASAIATCISRPADHFTRVAESDGEIIGYFGGRLGTYPFCNEILAHDLAFYVMPEHRASTVAVRFLRAFFAWAKQRGVREVQLGVSSGVDIDRIGALYERLGLRRMGGIYRGTTP